MPLWQPEKEWAQPPIPWNELVTLLEPKPGPARREDSEFSDRRFGKTGSGAQLFLRSDAPRNRATRNLPFRADRDDLEHAQVAIPLAAAS